MTVLKFPKLVSIGKIFPLEGVQAVTMSGEDVIVAPAGVTAELWSNGTIFADVKFAEAWRNGQRRMLASSVEYRADHTY